MTIFIALFQILLKFYNLKMDFHALSGIVFYWFGFGLFFSGDPMHEFVMNLQLIDWLIDLIDWEIHWIFVLAVHVKVYVPTL